MEEITYKTEKGLKGILYNWHNDPYSGDHYSMIIQDRHGRIILHSYNAAPKTIEELKNVVDREEKNIEALENK